MKHTSRTQPISWFQDHYRNGRLELRPPFQRKPVWTEKQRCALIESILLEIPIPEVYVQATQNVDGGEHFGVVDGQQRLRTILQFIGMEKEDDQTDENNNHFTLDSLSPSSPHLGKGFQDLTPETKRSFYRYDMCVRYLITDDLEEVQDIFKRLNKFTMPLKAQELRNATYHGAFADLSEELANDEFWAVNRIVSPVSIRRMVDIEMMSDLLIGLLHGPQGGSAKVINDYYDQYEQYEDQFPDQLKIKRQFTRALDTIKLLFPTIADTTRWSNKGDFYSLFIALGTLLHDHEIPLAKTKMVAKELEDFGREVSGYLANKAMKVSEGPKTYALAIEKGSNDRARRLARHKVLLDLLQEHFRKKK